MERYDRNLWAAVVIQARDDLDTENYLSVVYGEAVAFFTDRYGAWAESRQCIADQLDLHPDDLMRAGRSAITARSLRDGGPPVTVQALGRPPVYPRPVPRLTNPVPVVRSVPRQGIAGPAVISDQRKDWIRRFLTRRAA